MSRQLINPLAVIAGKQKLTDSEVVDNTLPLWLYVDRVLNKCASISQQNAITRHLITLQIIAANGGDKSTYLLTKDALKMWSSACELADQRDKHPELSTTAKRKILICADRWHRAMKNITLGALAGACARFEEIEKQFN